MDGVRGYGGARIQGTILYCDPAPRRRYMIAFSNVVAFSAFPRPRPLAPDFADVSLAIATMVDVVLCRKTVIESSHI
jgi:hypothetical protein